MTYRIIFDRFEAPEGADLAGYEAWAYLGSNGGMLREAEFATREAAEAALAEKHLGPDCDGVDAAFLIEELVSRDITFGTRVEAGEGEDYDTGRVDDIDGARAFVAWDSGVSTWSPIGDLAVID